MERPKPIWREDTTLEEISWIKKRLGEGYKNVPYRLTGEKSTGGISDAEEKLNSMAHKAEAEITESKSLEQEIGTPGAVKKIKEEIALLNFILEEVKNDDKSSNIEKMKKIKQVKNVIKGDEEKIEKIIDSN